MKILISGTGNMAHRHLEVVRELLPKAEIFSHSKSGRRLSNIPMLSWSELSQHQFDFAIIANAAPFHCEIARHLKNTPILMEKPVSNQLSEAKSLLEAEGSDRIFVGYHLHHSTSFKKVKSLIEKGELGRVLSVTAKVGHRLTEWRKLTSYKESVSANKDLGGGVLLELSHDIDYIRALFGMPQRVFCHAANSGSLDISPNVEDTAHCTLDYGRFAASLNLNMLELPPVRRCEILCSNGAICWDLRTDNVKLFNFKMNEQKSLNLKTNKKLIYHEQFDHFIRNINGEKNTVVVPLTDAVATLKIVDSCKSQSKRPMMTVFTVSGR